MYSLPQLAQVNRRRKAAGANTARLIVAATDFTPAAAAAARRAAELAASSESRLALLHAGGEDARERLRLGASRLALATGMPVEARLAVGPAPAAIAADAKAAGADLIVVGNRQSGFLRELLMLNTASRVLWRVGIPVLAVSQPADRRYRRVLLATDLSEASAQAGRAALRLFPDASLHVLHVSEALYEGSLYLAGVDQRVIATYRRRALLLAERELELFLRESLPGTEVRTRVLLGPRAAGIREHAVDIGADVLVLSPGRSWLARAMASSVSERLLAAPPCDVLLAG